MSLSIGDGINNLRDRSDELHIRPTHARLQITHSQYYRLNQIPTYSSEDLGARLSIITNYFWRVATALARCHELFGSVLDTPLLSFWWTATSI